MSNATEEKVRDRFEQILHLLRMPSERAENGVYIALESSNAWTIFRLGYDTHKELK